MGNINKQEPSTNESVSNISSKPICYTNAKQNNIIEEIPLKVLKQYASSNTIKSVKSRSRTCTALVSHRRKRHKKSLTSYSTTPCSPLSAFSTPRGRRRKHRRSLPNMKRSPSHHSHLDIKYNYRHRSLSPQPITLKNPTITPSPSASRSHSTLYLKIATTRNHKNMHNAWSEGSQGSWSSITNPFSKDNGESGSDTSSASTPWILYMDVNNKNTKPTLTLQEIHHEVMLSAPPSPSESIKSYDYQHRVSVMSLKDSSTPILHTHGVECADVQK